MKKTLPVTYCSRAFASTFPDWNLYPYFWMFLAIAIIIIKSAWYAQQKNSLFFEIDSKVVLTFGKLYNSQNSSKNLTLLHGHTLLWMTHITSPSTYRHPTVQRSNDFIRAMYHKRGEQGIKCGLLIYPTAMRSWLSSNPVLSKLSKAQWLLVRAGASRESRTDSTSDRVLTI